MIFGISRDEIKLAFRGVHYHIRELREELMADYAAADAKLDEFIAASTAERAQVEAGLAKITDLLAQLAAAQGAAAPDTQPLIDKMQAELDALKADDPA